METLGHLIEYTMPCGCEIRSHTVDMADGINWCPLHQAAPELLDAAKWGARSYHHPSCEFGKRGDGNTCTCHVNACADAVAKATEPS